MVRWKQYRWLVAVGIGLVAGLVLSGFWPHTPLYAVATDRIETFAMATGPVDDEVEAVYFLDFLTGDLAGRGAWASSRARGPASSTPTSPPIWASIRRRTRSS